MTTAHEVPLAELRDTLGDAVVRTAYTGERVVITRHGKPAAALVSTADLARLEALEMAEDVADFDKATAEDDGGRVSLDDYLAEG
ncbi:Conserved protein of uncharacterised function, putative antitoxin [Mycobacteroides abscessus subsp. abscessus]|uniref:type II toxin-antitoxin system prevent-host-death family antitoxin n=1 Tax=Mycobacteroides abscessus TaxID=36809 RepID=UPI0009266AF4|nr:type II toxin-antitoxin system prevent-host-death family antitoxin [Mycobacteroides abscessus]SIC55838.1 Conserved protein of uncharacterised function, putative antitoxin [Mycobacteroides abscessus subsp. abscessus]SKU57998.1 Conserved protein of uncharacterised function, putative antitoxin [Mycobacteroides abscessus subsp. abscessus]